MTHPTWTDSFGGSPLIAFAIHAGHEVESDLIPLMDVSSEHRLREEDPFTDILAEVTPDRVVAHHSRFEFDLNRPPESAVYIDPEDAWGIRTWSTTPPPELLERSRERHRLFYDFVDERLDAMREAHGRFLVLDLHSYNHRRNGPNAEPDDPVFNPEINLGTGTLDRERWRGVIDPFVETLSAGIPSTGRIDVRENVKFRGGYLARHVHERYPKSGCVLSVELRKSFMDEWSGIPDMPRIHALRDALYTTIPGLLDTLDAQ